MIEEIARVVAIDKGYAVVQVEKTSSCGSCSAKGACGTSSLAGLFNFKPPSIKIDNTLDAKVGDSVLLALPEQTLVTGSFLLYIVPLLTMVLFAGLVRFTLPSFEGELPQILAGLLGLIAGLLLVSKVTTYWINSGNSARLIKVIGNNTKSVRVDNLLSS